MGPPKFHEIKRSDFGGQYGHDRLKLYSLNDKNVVCDIVDKYSYAHQEASS